MNISLPSEMREFVDRRVADGSYASSSEYVRQLIRFDQARHELRTLILDGIASGPGPVVDDAYFEGLRERARARRA